VGIVVGSGGIERADEWVMRPGNTVGSIHRRQQTLGQQRRLGRVAIAWPAVLAGLWALGWTITASAGVDVEAQYTVFGSTGAIAVTAGTAILPIVLTRRAEVSSR